MCAHRNLYIINHCERETRDGKEDLRVCMAFGVSGYLSQQYELYLAQCATLRDINRLSVYLHPNE